MPLNFLVSAANKEIPSLNGLRGIAIILILFCHDFGYLIFPAIGWVGVDLFFVLSGFLITRVLLISKPGKNFFINFYARRILRIFPLYYLAILLMYVYDTFVKLPPEFLFSQYLGYYMIYLQNLIYFFKQGESEPNLILGHFWSLSVEEHFYLFWPLIIYYLNRRQQCIAGIAIIILCKVTAFLMLKYGMSWMAVYSFTFTRSEALVMGGIVAIMMASNIQVERIAGWLFIIMGISLAVYYSYSLYTQRNWNVLGPDFASDKYGGIILTAIGLFFSSVLIFSLQKNKLQHFLSRKWLFFFGKYSYGIYVFHYPVYALISFYRYKGRVNYSPFWPANWPAEIAVSLLCVLVSVGIAYISYHFFEKYFLALKMKFI